MDENNEIQWEFFAISDIKYAKYFSSIYREAEEFFRPRIRPASSSAIPRDITRNSTPNLSSKFKR
jgi:hypothetical protein